MAQALFGVRGGGLCERAFRSFLHSRAVMLEFNMRIDSAVLMTGPVLKVKSTLTHMGRKLLLSIGVQTLAASQPEISQRVIFHN